MQCRHEVPVEYANSKLWGITSEYENLLNIQRDQHLLAIQQHEAEAAHLRRTIEMLEEGNPCEESIASSIGVRESAHELAFRAKQRELELFGALLQMRDRQIGELQEVCETKQAEILEMRSMADATVSRIDDAPEEAPDEPRRAVEAAEPDFSQELRAEVCRLEAIIAERDQEVEAMAQALSSRAHRILQLEAEVGASKLERLQALQQAGAKLECLQEQLLHWRRECQAAQEQAEMLRAECTRHRVDSQHLERKVEEMGGQLANAEEALAQLLRSSSYKDQLIRTMTGHASLPEARPPAYLFDEPTGSRRPELGRLEQSPSAAVAELLRQL